MKVSAEVAVFKRESLLIGGAKHVDWGGVRSSLAVNYIFSDTVNSRFSELLGPAEKVRYIEGMPKAIAKEIGTSELVRYIV